MGGVDGKTRRYGSFGEGVGQVYTQTRKDGGGGVGSLEIFDFGHLLTQFGGNLPGEHSPESISPMFGRGARLVLDSH